MKRAFVLLLLAACNRHPGTTLPKPIDIVAHPGLQQAASCDALNASVQTSAIREMRSELDAEKNWYYYPMTAGGGVDTTPSAAGAPASYTTTNTQVAGVDEADFVKNDGTRIFVLTGQTLFSAKSWPPEALALAGHLDLEGWPSEMFLDNDQIVVFSSIWTVPTGGGMGPSGGGAGIARPCGLDGAGCFWGWGTTKVTVVDVSDLANPKVAQQLYLPGYSGGSRRVGSSVRLVVSDAVRWPEDVKWWVDYDPSYYNDHDKLSAAIDKLEDQNEAVIRATPLAHWFPDGQRKLDDGTVVDVGYQCSDFYLSNAPERLGLVTIATFDLAHLDQGVSRASIVGEAGTIYATPDHLYLASEHWWWWPEDGQQDYTYIHLFDISDPAKAGYIGSGGVPGHVGDQFSMDEKDGYLRVATSTAKWIAEADSPNSFRFELSNALSVLGPKPVTAAAPGSQAKNELALIGSLSPLEDGEALMATRFTGNTGYAVTFRYVDPLVTLDLHDPAHPKKVAELTLPGFSTYLQPIDDTHLLAIGEDWPLDNTGHVDWSHRSVDLSLFDVSDSAHPTRTAQALVGTAWAYSEALWDHHAFNWYQPDAGKAGLLAIPFSDWIQPAYNQNWYDAFVSDVRVFSVDAANASIQPIGALGMNDVYVQYGSGNWTWWYRPWVRRSVMATDQAGNTFVYAVSDAGLRSAALTDLTKPLATALFPQTR